MDSVFLSFHFTPRPAIVDLAREIIASHGLLVIDGQDLGGERLFPEIQSRIRSADACVSILTKDRQVDGHFEPARWVEAELQEARSVEKPTFSIVEVGTEPSPPFREHEIVRFEHTDPLPALIKLSRTLGLWRQLDGRTIRVRLFSDDLTAVDDEHVECSYQMRHGEERSAWQRAELFPEPGGLFIFVRGVRPDSFFRVRLITPSGTWQSPFSPQEVILQTVKVP